MTHPSIPLHLYSGRLSMFGAKVEIAALEKNIAVTVEMVAFSQAAGYSPKHAEVLRINPKKQVPVLVHGDVELFDSTQIFEYFESWQPEPALWPSSVPDRARARLLEHQADEVYFPQVVRLMGRKTWADDAAAVAAVVAARDFYQVLEQILRARDQGHANHYLAGGFSYADIGVYMALLFGARWHVDLTDDTPQLLAWRTRMGQRPAVRQVVLAMAHYLQSDGMPLPPFMAALLVPESAT